MTRSPSRTSSTARHHQHRTTTKSRRRSDSSDSNSGGDVRRREKSRNERRPKRTRSRSSSSSESSKRRRNDAKGRVKKERSRSASPEVDDWRHRQRRGNDERRGGRGGRGARGGRGGFRGRGRGRRGPGEEESFEWGKQADREEKPEVKVEKEQPNFGLSGKLTEAANMVNGVVVKYSEPPEARKSTKRWRFYVFKGEETLPTLYIHRQSAYLIGKDRRVADIRLDHPSISAQHAALQYRLVSIKSEDGVRSFKAIRPYIIDLESSNGTFLNNKKIEPKRYVELQEKDVLKFGFSSREYVVLHEHSQDNDSAEEIVDEGPNA
ncbi:smad nuclear-interacting protein 1-like [Cloeon dipterum]|uniref:smad nuclear-interacting protein 1-like n=1 Tax=Cloeon dipterum TaxID=197152 RepID=UPI0032205FB9